VIGSEKPCELYFHIGIVRGNKRQVNDYFSGDDSMIVDRGLDDFTGFMAKEMLSPFFEPLL